MPKDPTTHKGRRPKNPVAQEVKSVVAPLASAKLSQQLLENGQGFQRYESMDTAFALAELLGFVSYVASSSFSRTFPQAAKSMLTSGQKLVSADSVVPCPGIATSAQKHIDYSFSTALGSKASVTPCFFRRVGCHTYVQKLEERHRPFPQYFLFSANCVYFHDTLLRFTVVLLVSDV